MVAIGMLVILGGYSLGVFGWSLFRDYDITLGQMLNPVHPYGSGKGESWPPPKIPDTQIWPGGAPGGSAGGSGPGGSTKIPGSSAVKPKTPGKCPPGYLWDNRTKTCLQELP